MKCPDLMSAQFGPSRDHWSECDIQFRMLFSSGQAQMNGGGDFWIPRYSCGICQLQLDHRLSNDAS